MQSYWNASDTGTERDGGRTGGGGGGGGGGRHGQARSKVKVYLYTLHFTQCTHLAPITKHTVMYRQNSNAIISVMRPSSYFLMQECTQAVPAIFSIQSSSRHFAKRIILMMTMTMASAPRT